MMVVMVGLAEKEPVGDKNLLKGASQQLMGIIKWKVLRMVCKIETREHLNNCSKKRRKKNVFLTGKNDNSKFLMDDTKWFK